MIVTYLTPKLFVSDGITVMAQSLLQEGQQNGDNDTRLQCFSKTDEEN